MARKAPSTPVPEAMPELVVSRTDAAIKIADRIKKGQALLSRDIHTWEELKVARNDYFKWSNYNAELLRRLFTNNTLAGEYEAFYGASIATNPTLREDISDLQDGIKDTIHRLESIAGKLELIPEPSSTPTSPEPLPTADQCGNRVFVVHGHDEGARETTARFLERLGTQAIILHEQPNEGRTIIEKLKDRSANGTSASVGRAGRIMRSNRRGWPGWMRRSLRGAEEHPTHAQGRVFLVGADRS